MYSRLIPRTTRPTATTLPYDVLREIFLQCLPDEPLDRLQPNSHEPPMLLCYVCSYWRKVALGSPSLWSHIYYHLPIRWDGGLPVIWDLNAFEIDMKVLRWWRENQGSMAPFVRLQFYQEREHKLSEERYLQGDVRKFFIEYLSSAQYLDVGPFAQYLFQQDSTSGFPVAAPNLHTLVAFYDTDAFANIFGQTPNPTLTHILSFHIAPSLRRLSIHFEGILPRNFINHFSDWSRLTHLSIHKVIMTPNVWSSLIRGVTNLKWGFFWITIRQSGGETQVHPSRSTLPFLSTLSLQVFKKYNRQPELETLAFLLQHLHLPVLHNLTIYVDIDSRDLSGGIMTINTMLKSMPALRDLMLGLNFDPTYTLGSPDVDWEVVEQLSTLVSALTHLQLDMTYTRHPWKSWIIEDILAQWKKILSPKGWLNLRGPTNTIRKITIFILKPSIYGRLIESTLRNTLALDEEEPGRGSNNVVLEVVPLDESTDASEKWMTWGAR